MLQSLVATMLFSKSSTSLMAVAWTIVACSGVPCQSDQVTKDVLIIGGGASGAHAAVRLRDDYGLSVALIEKQDILVRLPFCRN